MTAADVDPVRSTVVAGFDDWLAELMAWLRIPSVSADPAHHGDVLASADFLAGGVAPHRLPDRRGVDRHPGTARGVRALALG